MRKMCVFLFCFSLTLAAFAQQTRTFTCTGKVVDSDAQPVSGAEVMCHERFYDYGEGRKRCELVGQARTNEEGRFSMDVKVTRKRSVQVVVRKQGLSLGWEGAAYDSADLDFDIQLDKPKVLAGTVVDRSGAGIADAKVQVCLKNEIMGRQLGVTSPVPESWYTTRTNAQGRFSFNNIPPDSTADFWVEAPGKVCIWTFWEDDNSPGMQFDAGRSDIRIVLGPEAKIKGCVIDENTGNPVGDIQLLARPDTRLANYYCADLVSSDKEGLFCFKGMPAGTYSLQVIPPREKFADWTGKDVKIAVEAGQTLDDVKVSVNKGAILEVLARDSLTDEPITGMPVTVSQKANYGRHPCYWKSVVTDDRGKALFRVPTGECSVRAGSSKYTYYQDTEPTEVVKGKGTKREIQLNRNPSISGIVRDKNGRPVKGVTVASKPVCEQVVRTDADGRFKVSWYGRHNIRKKFLLAQDIQHNLAGLVELQDESQPVDIRLEPALTLRGQVADPNGRGIARATVQLRASLPGWITNAGEQVSTDAKGYYQISAVPPPQPDFSYRIEVNAKGYGPQELRKISFGDDPAKPVEIETVVLPPADQSISGVVVDSNDKPAAGIRIFLGGPSGSRTAGQPERNTVTDKQGRFFIDGVCKGPLRIQAGTSSDPKGAGFMDAEGGDKDVKVILGQRLVHTKYVLLNGKPLPDLKDLKIEIPVDDSDSKMILVCFWDMEQRPSRNCIRQLAKQAEQLKQKGIIIVAVQASKVDENTLNDWVKKYKIPFPVGIVQGDDEKTRFAWGVRSLPWLILTDKEYVVRREGFGLEELAGKIKDINDAEE